MSRDALDEYYDSLKPLNPECREIVNKFFMSQFESRKDYIITAKEAREIIEGERKIKVDTASIIKTEFFEKAVFDMIKTAIINRQYSVEFWNSYGDDYGRSATLDWKLVDKKLMELLEPLGFSIYCRVENYKTENPKAYWTIGW